MRLTNAYRILAEKTFGNGYSEDREEDERITLKWIYGNQL
jgi:hypothetical protein